MKELKEVFFGMVNNNENETETRRKKEKKGETIRKQNH